MVNSILSQGLSPIAAHLQFWVIPVDQLNRPIGGLILLLCFKWVWAGERRFHRSDHPSSQPPRCRSFCHSTVTARCHSLSQLGKGVMAGRVGRSRGNFNEQILVQQPFQVPLQIASVDGRTESLEIPNGQPAILEKIAQRFALALVQAVLFHTSTSRRMACSLRSRTWGICSASLPTRLLSWRGL